MNKKIGFDIHEMQIGQQAALNHTVSKEDVAAFARLSGDDNPVHLDEDFARNTPFKGCIAHGIFSAGLISALAGTRLPGYGCIYVKQDLRFKAPVRIGDTVQARVEVQDINVARRRVTLKTECRVGETVVLDGQAEFYIPPRT